MYFVSSMDGLIQQFACCFTDPSFRTFSVIVTGWLLGRGRRTVTGLLLAGNGLEHKTFSCYHRFFSQARWTMDALGRILFLLVLTLVPEGTILVAAIDDTLTRKSGKRIWAAGMHHDPLLSTGQRKFFSFGHNGVVLSIQVSFPFAPDKI